MVQSESRRAVNANWAWATFFEASSLLPRRARKTLSRQLFFDALSFLPLPLTLHVSFQKIRDRQRKCANPVVACVKTK